MFSPMLFAKCVYVIIYVVYWAYCLYCVYVIIYVVYWAYCLCFQNKLYHTVKQKPDVAISPLVS